MGSILPGGGTIDAFAPKPLTSAAPPMTTNAQDYARAKNQGMPGYDILGDPIVKTPVQKPSEPAVLSSQGASDRISDAKVKLASMGQKGITVDQETGAARYADGSAVPAPAGSNYNPTSGLYEAQDGKNYSVAEFYGQDDGTADDEYTAVSKLFEPLKATLDSNTLAQVNAIHQQFDSLKKKQEEFNRRAEQARSRSLILGGSSRYAPLSAAGIMLSQTSYGLQQIQDLDAKENMAIAQAYAAQQDGNMKLMTQALNMAEGIRKDKQNKAADVMKSIQGANEKLSQERKQLDTDEAVADLMTQGITDPAQMMNLLNEYEDGSSTGRDVTAKDVAAAIKNLTPAEKKSTDIYKFSTTDVGMLLASGMNAGQIQATQDYYNGHAEAPALDAKQQAAVQLALAGKKPASEGDYTPTEKRKLEQAGLLNASRQKQLDFLYGPNSGDPDQNTPVTVPEFADYLGQWITDNDLPMPMLTEQVIAKVRAQYDDKYGSASAIHLGKLTPTNKNDLSQAGLSAAAPAVQSYFLNAPASFRDTYQRKVANGEATRNPTIDELDAEYQTWYNETQAPTGSFDWDTLLGP